MAEGFGELFPQGEVLHQLFHGGVPRLDPGEFLQRLLNPLVQKPPAHGCLGLVQDP